MGEKFGQIEHSIFREIPAIKLDDDEELLECEMILDAPKEKPLTPEEFSKRVNDVK